MLFYILRISTMSVHHDCQNFIKGKNSKLKWERNLANLPQPLSFSMSSSFPHPLPTSAPPLEPCRIKMLPFS